MIYQLGSTLIDAIVLAIIAREMLTDIPFPSKSKGYPM